MKYSKEDVRKGMTLYAITDRMLIGEGQTLFSVCEVILRAGATFLQLREKDMAFDELVETGKKLQKLCTSLGVPFVMNDSVDAALAADCDGVHLGQSDLTDMDVRSRMGEKILGISCRTVEEAVMAEKMGADYIGVGAVFPTGTKDDAKVLEQSVLREITQAVSIPVVAIGGIHAENVHELEKSGISGVAVISELFGALDPSLATKRLKEEVEEHLLNEGEDNGEKGNRCC